MRWEYISRKRWDKIGMVEHALNILFRQRSQMISSRNAGLSRRNNKRLYVTEAAQWSISSPSPAYSELATCPLYCIELYATFYYYEFLDHFWSHTIFFFGFLLHYIFLWLFSTTINFFGFSSPFTPSTLKNLSNYKFYWSFERAYTILPYFIFFFFSYIRVAFNCFRIVL